MGTFLVLKIDIDYIKFTWNKRYIAWKFVCLHFGNWVWNSTWRGEQSFNENNIARWFWPVRTFKLERFISTLICVMARKWKTFFFSRNVLPHDQQQRIRLIQTVTIKKAEIHSNISLGNKYLRYLGEELGKLCPARNTNALAAIVLSLSQDRSVCSGINITAMRQKP